MYSCSLKRVEFGHYSTNCYKLAVMWSLKWHITLPLWLWARWLSDPILEAVHEEVQITLKDFQSSHNCKRRLCQIKGIARLSLVAALSIFRANSCFSYISAAVFEDETTLKERHYYSASLRAAHKSSVYFDCNGSL